MNRMVLGALAALLMVSAGLFWWQGRAELTRGLPPPDISGAQAGGASPADEAPISLPSAATHGRGASLPRSGKPKASTEQKKFTRFDKNRDGQITRTEMLSTRVKAFEKLDTNHDNMLSFEEWAVKTSDRFKEIDSNHDGIITPAELAAYDTAMAAKKKHRKPGCSSEAGSGRGKGDAGAGAGKSDGDKSEDDSGEPAT